MCKIDEAIGIITLLGFPKQQQNERSALCLLSLLDLKEDDSWSESKSPLIGITPMMEFASNVYGKSYKPNSRETFRRQTMHQFVDGALAICNPDRPKRPKNSPKTVYQIEPLALWLLKSYNTDLWGYNLDNYLKDKLTLVESYAAKRELVEIPIEIKKGETIKISPGKHSQLIKEIIEIFAPKFTPGAKLIYVGDTGSKVGYFNEGLLAELGVKIDKHGKMPDVVFYFKKNEWLILIESVTSHGPVDSKRHNELAELFKDSKVGIVYVTAFPNKKLMSKYLPEIAWETEVWLSSNPTHLIHFNGIRFLGPY